MCFYTHILNGFDTDYLFNIDAQQLVMFVFHSQPQRANISGGTAHGNHIHRTYILFHRFSSVSYELADKLEKLTGQETRVVIPGHFQRGGSPCPRDRVLATRFGTAAARLIMEKKYGYMVGIVKDEIVAVPLAEAASQTKFLPVDHPLIQAARDAGTCFGD